VVIDFDLGAPYAVDRIAIWNGNIYGANPATGINEFYIHAANNPDFSDGVNLGLYSILPAMNPIQNQVVDLPATAPARYIRLEVLNNHGNPGHYSVFEVALAVAQPGACTLDLGLSYVGDTLEMDFTIGTNSPRDFNLWLSVDNLVVPLVTGVPIPVVDPPVSVPVDLPLPGGLGGIGVLSTMVDAGGIQCSDWETIVIP
jgi:hypothetical protein